MSGRFVAVALGAALIALSTAALADPGGGNGRADGGQAIPLRPSGPIPGQYIVVLKDDVANAAAAAQGLARAHGLRLGFVYGRALKGFSAQVPERALAGLQRDPRVAYIEADQWAQTNAQSLPTGIARIFADANPNLGINGADDSRVDVDVAVIDTGIDAGHSDLDVVGGTDCSGSSPYKGQCSGDGAGAQHDGNGHGTHVAGTIGAIDNGYGVVGVAPGARFWAVKVLKDSGSGWYSGVIAGIDWVTNRADLIEVANMSLGGGSSQALCQAIRNSVRAGITYAVAAGNESDNAANHSPANCETYFGNGLDGMITVSALADFNGAPGGGAGATCRSDTDDSFANFSNYGGVVDVIAPGVCIYSTWTGGGYNTISGTSMATPHVAGAAALLAASGLSDPAAIQAAIVANGNYDWNASDDPDSTKEPLLDVGDTSVFDPAADGAGSQPVAPTDDPPQVSWVNPSAGSTVSGTLTLEIAASDDLDGAGTLTVQWRVDGGSLQGPVSYADPNYEVLWDTLTLSDGSHTLRAQAIDSADQTSAEASVTVTVDNVPDPLPAGVAGAEVAYGGSGGKNGDKHLEISVTALDADDQPVAGADIAVVVTNDSLSISNSGSGTTGSDGRVLFSWKNAPSGGYRTAVTADGVPLDPADVVDGASDAGYSKP